MCWCTVRKLRRSWWVQSSLALVKVLAGWHQRLDVMCCTQTFILLRPSFTLSNLSTFVIRLSVVAYISVSIWHWICCQLANRMIQMTSWEWLLLISNNKNQNTGCNDSNNTDTTMFILLKAPPARILVVTIVIILIRQCLFCSRHPRQEYWLWR